MAQLVAALPVMLALILAIYRVPLAALKQEPRLQHLLYGSALLLLLTWSFRAGLSEGLNIHFLGMTALTLMFGWDLAVLAATAVILVLTITGLESWDLLSINLLSQAVVPASLCVLIFRSVERWFPPNFFIYLFLTVFIGGGLTAAGAGLTLALALGFAEVHDWSKIYLEYVRYLPLIMFPEGLINGVIMSAMMVFHPDWIRSFDARRYIDEQ